VTGLDDPTLEDAVGPTAWQELREAASCSKARDMRSIAGRSSTAA
jgi:hypothetical protein